MTIKYAIVEYDAIGREHNGRALLIKILDNQLFQ